LSDNPDSDTRTGIEPTLTLFFFSVIVAFGLYTIVYDLALLLSCSLATTMLSWTIFSAFSAIFWRSKLMSGVGSAFLALRHIGRNFTLQCLVAIALITASASLLINKFNEDDSFYMSRAVLDWENWRLPIQIDYPFAFTSGAGGLFTSLPSFEHFISGIAGLTGLHPLDVYYLVAPAIVGFLLPLAWYTSLRRVALGIHGAVIGTAFIVTLMLLDGTTTRGIADFSLFRLWQGKVILICVLTPLAIATAVDAVEQGSFRQWAALVLLGVAGLGLSTTAAFFLPVLVGVTGLSWWLTMRSRAPVWRAPLASLAVFAYPALWILPLYSAVSGAGMIFASQLSFDLIDTLKLVYGSVLSPTVIAAALGASALLVAGRLRLILWIAIWTATIALPMALPPTASLIVHYGTSADAMWRLAYASPVVLIIGLGLGVCSERPRFRPAAMAVLAIFAAAVPILALMQAEVSPFSAKDVIFPTLAYKVPPARLIVAQAIAQDLPPGTILAPEKLSVVLPLVTGKLRLTNFRSFDAPLQLILDGRPADAEALARAFDYVSGFAATPEHFAAFKKVIGWRLNYVVLGPDMSDQCSAATALIDSGYQEWTLGISDYRLFGHGAPHNQDTVLPIGPRNRT
jgi:hypothetical protein